MAATVIDKFGKRTLVSSLTVTGKTSSSQPSGVSSFNGRDGAVVPQNGDYTATMVGALPNTTVIPTKTSQLTNDSGFTTNDQLQTATSDFVTMEDVAQELQDAIDATWEASY